MSGIYLTNSRGGFLAFIVIVGLYFLLRGEAMKRIAPTKLAAAGLAFFLLMMVGPSRMGSSSEADTSSTAGRIDAWQEGLEMLRESPLFGIGQGEWRHHHHRLAHNSLVQTMGETGFLGLGAWLGMLFVFLRALVRIVWDPRDPQEKSMAAALLMAFTGFLAASFFVTTTQFDLFYIFFGLTTGLYLRRGEAIKITTRDVFRIAGMTVVGVVTIYITVRVYYGG